MTTTAVGKISEAVMEGATRLSRDIRAASVTLTSAEVRFLVDAYYSMQDSRIRTGHQRLALQKQGEPNSVLDWLHNQDALLEKQVAGALKRYVESTTVGAWALSIMGVGPIITAGMLAHIDITRAPTVGHIWSFAGLDPTKKWEKGKRRPWNAALKRLAFLLGESFVKVQNRDGDIYGQIYAARKELEIERNERGDFKDQAAETLATKNFSRDTDAKKAYEAGILPPARIHMRAKRYAVKLYLSHLHEAMYFNEYGKLPPLPYPVVHLGHAHVIVPPNTNLIPGWTEARAAIK